MQPPRPDVPTRIVIGAVAAGTLIRIPQLFHSLAEAYAFRQAQTAMVADVYASDGIDLLATPLPIFGASSNVPMEFPLFQAIASLGISAGLESDLASRLLGLISFQLGAVLLYALVRRWSGARAGVIAVVLFEVLPFGLFWGAASLIDFFAVALAMAMVLALAAWFETGRWWTLAAGAVTSILAFLVKVTTAPLYCFLMLAAAAIVVATVGFSAAWRRILAGFAVGPGLGLIAAVIWTRFSDAIKSQNPQTEFLTSSALSEWNFGTLAQRLDAHTWLRIGARVLTEIALPVAIPLVLGFVVLALTRSRVQRLILLGWLLTAAAGPLVFTNLYFIHSYYLIAVYPALVAIAAVGADWVWTTVKEARLRQVVLASAIVAVLGAAVVAPPARSDIAGLITDVPIPAASLDLARNTEPGSRIVAVGCGWDPSLFYFADRRGAMLGGWPADEFWERERIEVYAYVYTCDPEFASATSLPESRIAIPTASPALFRIAVRESTSTEVP